MQAELDKLKRENEALRAENALLHRKIDFLVQRLFGRKSEKLSQDQLEFLLGDMAPSKKDDEPPPTGGPSRSRRGRDRKPRLPEDLPTEEVVIDPEAVKQDPNAYQCIGEETTEELDVVPTQYIRRRIIRRKFVRKENRACPPLIAPLPPRVIEGGYASAGLLTDIILKKYVDHLPLYRQEQILRTRYGITLSRKTMCDWVRVVADWLRPVYQHIRDELKQGDYMQVDETPVRYCGEEGSRHGYLWVYHRPGGEVLFEWHTSRAATCLDGMLQAFKGTVQCDGYGGYRGYAKDHPGIQLAACWAHVRRKFFEAQKEAPVQAGWFLNQIGLLYGIEREYRDVGSQYRQVIRRVQSAPILVRMEKALKLTLGKHRPTSAMGLAIAYTLNLWPQLLRFRDDGRLEIDNNGVENAIRPTALGKKNWMFIGHPEAGDRSAIIYTLLENCKRMQINPQVYLHDVLSRIPAMTNQQTQSLTPANWIAARSRTNAA